MKEADEPVPHPSQLRCVTESWEEAMTKWFHGGLLCETSKRYVANFLSVYRVRPGKDDDLDIADEDMASDEELELEDDDLEEVLRTRVGGRERHSKDNDDSGDEAGGEGRKTHHANSEEAMAQGHAIWTSSVQAMAQRSTPSVRSDINEVLAAAKASRARDKGFTSMVNNAQQEGYVRDMETSTIQDAQAWLEKLKVHRNKEGN